MHMQHHAYQSRIHAVQPRGFSPAARSVLRRFACGFGAALLLATGCKGKADSKPSEAASVAASDAAAAGSREASLGSQLVQPTSAKATGTPAFGDTLTDNDLIARADAGRLMGRDSGAMWLIVISDFQCPYCQQWHATTHAALKRDYVDDGRVRVGYLNYPLQQHPHARVEAIAGLCASAQGKFFPYADGLFHEQDRIARMSSIEPLVDSLGKSLALDMTEFARCRKTRAINMLVESDIQQAVKAGVQSTPSFLIGEFLVQGAMPYPDFKRAVDSALVIARIRAKGKP